MADSSSQNKTEQPTPRRLEKAREDGNVAFSGDLSTAILMCAGSLFFLIAGPWFGESLLQILRDRLSHFYPEDFHYLTASQLVGGAMEELAALVLPLAAGVAGVLIVAGATVTGFQLAVKPLVPDLNRLNPQKGFERIFSSRAVVRGLFSVAKVALMAVLAFFLIQSQMGKVAATAGASLEQTINVGWDLTTQLALAISAGMLAVGVSDLAFQQWKRFEELKMTRQEVLDEHKQDEGDPHLNARIKKVQREIVEKQMLKDVKTGHLTLKNPTHIAVTLRYDRAQDAAPIVVAKGEEDVALLIVKLSKEHGVPVVERRPLARALYYNVEVGQEIPVELYQAIAEILAYVQRQRNILQS